jgi:hypothetical protein
LLDPEVIDARVERGPVDAVAVSDQICRQEVRADGVDDLLRGPRSVGLRCHVDVQYTAAFERKDEEDVDDVEGHRRYSQEVDRDRSREMVVKEGLPRLRGWAAWLPSRPRHILRDSILIDGMTEFR